MKTIVISLGGSLIIPDKVDYKFLEQFKTIINKYKKKYKFIIITGGGKTARTYIEAVRKEKLSTKYESIVGILATKINARLVAGLFNIKNIPETEKELKKQKTNPIICGALGNRKNMTSDANAAELAKLYNATFINMTNVKGLYTKDPKKYKTAKFIKNISYKEFNKIIKQIKYKAGQHFVLDQVSAKIIMQSKVPTIILKGNKQLENFLSNKKYQGTIISS
jgi:uridylate kinase